MHIPDGFLAASTWLPAWLLSLAGIGISVKRVTKILKEKMVPLMGVMSAFVFAAQMLNFPVAGGTSGHLLGGVMAAVLLGPYAAALVIACVLVVQCLVFQDGGMTAFGANVFNMSIVGAMGGYCIYSAIKKICSGPKSILIATAVASWCSVILASSACAVELAISGTSPLKIVLPAMLGFHALIGLGEAAITVIVVSFVLKVRPDLIFDGGIDE